MADASRDITGTTDVSRASIVKGKEPEQNRMICDCSASINTDSKHVVSTCQELNMKQT